METNEKSENETGDVLDTSLSDMDEVYGMDFEFETSANKTKRTTKEENDDKIQIKEKTVDLNGTYDQNDLKIESVSGTWYMDSFSLYRPDVTFLSGDVETEVVPEGMLSAEIMFGGLMIGEEVEYYLAVYEVNEHNHTKLIGVDMGSTVVTESTIATMEVENVEKNENCTYTAKVFLWNNMTGAVYPIS